MRISNHINILTFVKIKSNVMCGGERPPGGTPRNVSRAYLQNSDAWPIKRVG